MLQSLEDALYIAGLIWVAALAGYLIVWIVKKVFK